MKKLILLLGVAIFSLHLYAQQVTMNEARRVAQSFLSHHQRSVSTCAKVVTTPSDTLLYIFNADNSFVVISGDKRVTPVLAFSDHQLYNDNDVIDPVKMWLESYQRQLAALKEHNLRLAEDPSWQKMLSLRDEVVDTLMVAPLVQSHWGQGTNYSYYCPRDYAGENGRCVTGCVATAMAQLIYYFRFPQYGVGSYSYTDDHYGVQSADYAQTHFDYESMCDEPTHINTAISTLMHHAGVGVDMVYGPDGSGMYNHSAARVLHDYFKFSPETRYLYRDSTDLNWDSVIVAHLERAIPMYYAGWSVPNINGHGFLCDGYRLVDSVCFFHFNFGWDGSYDGYFYTNHLYVGGSNFNIAQELIVNGYPDTAQYQYPESHPATGQKIMTSSAGSDVVGGPLRNSSPNMDFTWIIRPEMEGYTGVTVDIDYDLSEGDSLLVITSGSAPATYAHSLESGSLHFLCEGPEVTIRLKTSAVAASANLRISYNANNESYCSGTRLFSSPTGSFDDGSQNENYHSFSNCRYKIVLPSYTAITVRLFDVDLEPQHDFLYVFDNQIDSSRLLATFTGNIADTTIVFDYKRLSFLFESDETGTAGGFNVEYSGGFTGIDELPTNDLQVYPNPANSFVTLQSQELMKSVTVLNMLGQTVGFQLVDDTQCHLPVSDLQSGAYFLRIEMDGRSVLRKLLKQ